MPHSWDIVGYSYQADLYCPACIIDQLPTGEGQAFDGWKLAPGVRMTTEANLAEVAAAFGIDRDHEATYDSGDFPKVIFLDMAEHDDRCAACGRDLQD